MATYRNIFQNTLYSSELYQVYQTANDNPRNILAALDMRYEELKKARVFAKRVFSIDSEKWTRTVVNQLRAKGLRRSTQYPNIRKFGYDIDDYERLLSRTVGNQAYIGAPASDLFIRLYVVDDVHVVCDDRDVTKLDEYLARFL